MLELVAISFSRESSWPRDWNCISCFGRWILMIPLIAWYMLYLEEGMEMHSSILAWRIPWTEESGGLQSTGSQRVGHDWSNLAWTMRAPALLFCITCICHDSYFYVSGYKNKHKSSWGCRWPSVGESNWAKISKVRIPFQPRNSILKYNVCKFSIGCLWCGAVWEPPTW